MNKQTTLILGGARSGKSSYAERLCEKTGLDLVYIATGEASDKEMQKRIEHHKKNRGDKWVTIEEPVDISSMITLHSNKNTVILVDCLTIWLSNLMYRKSNIQEETDVLINAIKKAPGPVFLVSNEVGQGIVPENALARDFRDEAGRLNQKMAAATQNVDFILAGLPLSLKKNGQPINGAY